MNEEVYDDESTQGTGYEPDEREGADFNVEEEYKPIPYMAKGWYNGAITDVAFNDERQSVDWTVTLNGNGGYMNDGETPIDGTAVYLTNWLPLVGDRDVLTKSKKQTKHQAKVSFLRDFAKGMKITMNDLAQIKESIANSDWIGIEVSVFIDIHTWEGRLSNRAEKVKAV